MALSSTELSIPMRRKRHVLDIPYAPLWHTLSSRLHDVVNSITNAHHSFLEIVPFIKGAGTCTNVYLGSFASRPQV